MKMKKSTTRLALGMTFLLVALAVPQRAGAAPFSAKTVPAQAEGLIHIDVEKLRSSALWTLVRDQMPADAKAKTKGDLSAQLVTSFQKLGEEGMADVALHMLGNARSITVWAAADDSWAAIIDLPLAGVVVAAIEKASSLPTSKEDGITLYQVGDDAVMTASGNRIIVGQSKKAVLTTARLHSGKGKSLSGKRLSQLSSSASNGIVLVAGFGGKLMEEFKKEAASKMLKADIRSVLFFAGESKGNFFAQAEADLDSAETASNLASVASGLMGMLALSNDEPELKMLANGLRISAKGAVLKARFELPMSTLATLVAKP